MKNLIVRRAAYGDIAHIYSVNKICLPIAYSILEYIMFLASSSNVIFVAEYQNVIVGYILGEITKVDENKSKVHIMSFGVLPNFRKHRVGTKLMNKIIEHAKSINHNIMSLYVHAENHAGISFYKKHGFNIVKTLTNFYNGSIPYEKTCDAYYMELIL